MFGCFLCTGCYWLLCQALRLQWGAEVHVLCPHRARCWSYKHISQTKMGTKEDVNHGKCCQGPTLKCSRMQPGQGGQGKLSGGSEAWSAIWKTGWIIRRPVQLECGEQSAEAMQSSEHQERHWFLRALSWFGENQTPLMWLAYHIPMIARHTCFYVLISPKSAFT